MRASSDAAVARCCQDKDGNPRRRDTGKGFFNCLDLMQRLTTEEKAAAAKEQLQARPRDNAPFLHTLLALIRSQLPAAVGPRDSSGFCLAHSLP